MKPPLNMDDLKGLFDIAVHSMDFGSGFLSTEEVDLLRRVAEQIGVDPLMGTPESQIGAYPHPFKLDRNGQPYVWNERVGWGYVRDPTGDYVGCAHYACKKPQDHPVHRS